jgi:hypothetical protein
MELTSLAATLGIKESGNFMLVPLLHEVNGPIGGLLLFSSYSQRVWSLADQEYLMAGTSYLVEILRGREQSALGGRIGGITTPLERDPGFIASIADADAAPVQPVVLPRSSDILPPLSGKMQTDAPISMIELPAEVPELARQQIQELQEALSYARQRLERLEKATDPTRANSENRLSTLLEGALLQAGRSFEDRHVTMRVDIPASLPALRGDPAALNDVLKIALEKALQDVAVAGTIVLKAQAGLSPEGTPHVHLKVISSGTPGQETSQSGIDAGTETTNGLLTRASLLMADQSGRLWVDTLAGGALVTNLLIPAEPEPRSMKPSPHPG